MNNWIRVNSLLHTDIRLCETFLQSNRYSSWGNDNDYTVTYYWWILHGLKYKCKCIFLQEILSYVEFDINIDDIKNVPKEYTCTCSILTKHWINMKTKRYNMMIRSTCTNRFISYIFYQYTFFISLCVKPQVFPLISPPGEQ